MRRINAIGVKDYLSAATSPVFDAGLAQPAFNVYTRHTPIETATSKDLNGAAGRALSRRYAVLKRALDILVATILLPIFLPIGLVISLLVLFSSPGPIFYREDRIGRFGASFRIIKFRSMYCRQPQTESNNCKVPHLAAVDAFEDVRMKKKTRDPRITPLGRYLRRLSLDELPQLLNVLAGDMSLVGPRPIVTAERGLYGGDLVYYYLLCPGITGLWQVSGRSDVDYEKRVSLDKKYATSWSCLLDLMILARTIPVVLKMQGAY